MNWQDKIPNLKNLWKPGSIAWIPVFFSCDTAGDFGAKFDLDTNVDVKVIDFHLPATNLFIDSLSTNGEDQILVGRYADPLTGSVEAEGYFQYVYLSGSLPGDSLSYDSLNLRFEINGSLPQTGASTVNLEIFELEDTLFSGIVYLASKEQVKTRQIGGFSRTTSPGPNTIYDFRLDDVFGQGIFDFAQEFPDSITSHLFNGIAVVPGPTSDNIININLAADTTRLSLYMSSPDSNYVAEFLANTVEYTYLQRDRSASPFSPIVEGQNFELPDGSTVLDPLTGITTAFSIEGIGSFFADNNRILINSAILEFDIQDNLLRDTVDLFRLYFRKSDGGIFGPASASAQTAFPNIVMSDNGYLTLQNTPALASIDEDIYSVGPTLFFQALYNNYPGLNRLAYMDPFSGDSIGISELVVVSPIDVTLQQTIFNNPGINLRVFYTEVN